MRSKTYYDILGIPMGASVDHIKDSYRLLTRKTLVTDVVYQTLTAPEKRREYDARLIEESKSEQDWGSRGRERCSCGTVLNIEDDWYCPKCAVTLEYFVLFDMSGGYVIHDSEMPVVTEPDGQTFWQVPFGTLYGPFSKEEAQEVLEEKNKMRKKK